MKKILLMAVGLLTANVSAQFECMTDKKMKEFYKNNPQGLKAREDLYKYLSNKNNLSKNTQTVVTIPIVVHVLYKNEVQNVSDAQIASQIAVLNQDFRKANADFNNAPAVFKPVGSDMQVMFCLATKDPNGNPTTGIVRKSIPSNFNFDDHYYDSSGSLPWDNTKYLNIWVGKPNYASVGGWSSMPDGAEGPSDGIAINYRVFGTMGTAESPYNKGRCTTHEVGHYLGLWHPFGGDINGTPTNTLCGVVNDFCADTPATYYAYFGAPTFPDNTYMCTPTADGAMFMNFMDYTRDAVKVMFTNDQKTLVTNALAGPRASLLNNNACSVLATSEVEKVDKINLFPNPTTQYISIASPLMAINEVEVFNTEGRLVKKASIKNETDRINVSDFPSGIYFVRTYKDKKFIKSMKFIKK